MLSLLLDVFYVVSGYRGWKRQGSLLFTLTQTATINGASGEILTKVSAFDSAVVKGDA